ncbi:hypothetical protein CAPTEDRAFT_209270 [Capitella teleta]|uniref:Uncharacterized protein n=1 Tax=Capitella teleta TaxID=283909 RepID=R7UFV2_CAPTE|nr:hypothetical protein CAPTEDRAFT_209270 [Capitella teleta]|eukprot:ELU02167.1 hypothetical protein CAPTEDRAFT_209270 [Capitella teleta]
MESSIVKRSWMSKQGHNTEAADDRPHLKLMTYNILADGSIQEGEYALGGSVLEATDTTASSKRSNIVDLMDQEVSLSTERIKLLLKLSQSDLTEEDDVLRLAQRGLGCLLAKFKFRSNGNVFNIGNIHIKWTCFTLPGLACFETTCAVQALNAIAGDGNLLQWASCPATKPLDIFYFLFGNR